MTTVSVSHLKKYFKVYKKSPGFWGSIFSLVSREEREIRAIDDISFEIEKGELVGFIGPNGAGKTTTLKCLSGLLYPSAGDINVIGFIPNKRENEFLKHISLIMGQKNQLWLDLPAIETFRLNKEIYEIDDRSFNNTLAELVSLLEVKNLLNIPVRQLSLGQRMKMELIADLLHKPKVLFLDEPTIGLDVVMQKKIRDFIAAYNNSYQSTILLTSHYIADVRELCKRVIIIDHGKIIYDGQLTKLVKKYSQVKTITVVLNTTKFDPHKFTELGTVRSIDFPKVIFQANNKEVKMIAAKLLRDFPVEDLTIEEPPIEDVIRLVFSKKHE